MKAIAVSNRMLNAAQASYDRHPSYGLTAHDMRGAIRAALDQAPALVPKMGQAALIARLTAENAAKFELLESPWKTRAADAEKEIVRLRAALVDCIDALLYGANYPESNWVVGKARAALQPTKTGTPE